MKRKEFLVNLVSEVSRFMLQGELGQLVISLRQEPEGIHLCVIDNCEHSDAELASINGALHARARPELAGYYGSMAGHDLLGSARLNLVGWQVKSADVSRRPEGGIMLNLWIGNDKFDPSRIKTASKVKDQSKK